VIAPEANAEFVAAMEDVLDVYHRPYDPNYPVVCFDESNKQQVKEKRIPLPMAAGQPERYDCEYERNGVSNLFMVFEPLAAQRHVSVTDRRTALDYAAQMQELVDVHYPNALKVVVVQDQLNTHCAASLYKAFEPGRCPTNFRQTRVTLYSQAWQLVKHGRDRVKCIGTSMLGASDS